MTYRLYKAFDIVLFAVLLAIFEAIVTFAKLKWFPLGEPYFLSLTCAMVAIMMMRWGWWSIVHQIVGGFIFSAVYIYCGFAKSPVDQLLIYTFGGIPSVFAMIFVLVVKKEKIRSKWWLSVIFVSIIYILMHLGHALMSLALGQGFAFSGFLAADSISLVFALVAVLITRNLDGLFEDQKTYLFRQERERKEKAESLNENDF